MSIVFAEDGKVYMKNPLLAMAYDTWVEGTLSEDGTRISIPMGQTLYHSDFYDADVILSWVAPARPRLTGTPGSWR